MFAKVYIDMTTYLDDVHCSAAKREVASDLPASVDCWLLTIAILHIYFWLYIRLDFFIICSEARGCLWPACLCWLEGEGSCDWCQKPGVSQSLWWSMRRSMIIDHIIVTIIIVKKAISLRIGFHHCCSYFSSDTQGSCGSCWAFATVCNLIIDSMFVLFDIFKFISLYHHIDVSILI